MQMGIGSKLVALHSAPLAPVLIPKGGGEKISATQIRRLKQQMTSTAPMGEKQPSRRRLIRRPVDIAIPRGGTTVASFVLANG
eukprot:scaffold28854_cov65-Phaeocystis_antarctica.AAC.3